ncbi:hypothetical protein COL516b_006670 [Colletotrichum fioriniae]|nr:uncharacterized protein COL516b_006670 [Colletotrichum fioriniae]KAJ0303159.1 hypothetical protein COL516b_006670 [Colletotrichum fioriniae]
MESPERTDEQWWADWDDMMASCYFRDNPVAFYTRILYPKYPPYEINPENYLKVERAHRRKLVAEHPDWYEQGYEVFDSDDDYSGLEAFEASLFLEGILNAEMGLDFSPQGFLAEFSDDFEDVT